jgi:hypothetical protein
MAVLVYKDHPLQALMGALVLEGRHLRDILAVAVVAQNIKGEPKERVVMEAAALEVMLVLL